MTAVVDDAVEIRRSWLDVSLTFCRRQPLGSFGLAIVIITAVAGLLAEWIAPTVRPPTISRR